MLLPMTSRVAAGCGQGRSLFVYMFAQELSGLDVLRMGCWMYIRGADTDCFHVRLL